MKQSSSSISQAKFKQFEIDSYKAEQELALGKFRAEASYHEILNSRTWRYTAGIRRFAGSVSRYLEQTRVGRFISSALQKVLR